MDLFLLCGSLINFAENLIGTGDTIYHSISFFNI